MCTMVSHSFEPGLEVAPHRDGPKRYRRWPRPLLTTTVWPQLVKSTTESDDT